MEDLHSKTKEASKKYLTKYKDLVKMITGYESFERLNKQVLSEYVKNYTAGRRFIKEKFGALKKTDPTQSSFYHFFKILDQELDKAQD